MRHPLLAPAVLVPSLFLPASAQEPTPEPPPVVRGLRVHEAGAFDGYTLFSPLSSGTTYLIDMQGQVVHRWETGLPVAAMAFLLDDGHLLRTVRVMDNERFYGGGLGGRIQELDWDGKVVWDFRLSNEQQSLHHVVDRLPNGNLLAIAWEHVSPEDAIALGRDPKKTSEKGWWPDVVLELEPERPSGAKVVWEWHARDHLVQDFDEKKSGFGSVAAHPGRFDVNADHRDDPPMTPERRAELEKRKREMARLGYTGGDDEEEEPAPSPDAKKAEDKQPEPDRPSPDWMHTNAVDYHPELDLVVLSSPHLHEIFVIDHSTTTAEARGESGGRWKKGGALLYRWGHPRNYGAGENTDQQLFGQHDSRWLATGSSAELRLLLFNNGVDRPAGAWSSVEEIVLPFDAKQGFAREPGKAFGPAQAAWTYTGPEKTSFHSSFISGAQRLPNGSTLVCSGAQGRFFEVTPQGKIVWEYWNEHGGEIPASFGKAADRQPKSDPKAVFQATRIAKDHPGLRGKDLQPEPSSTAK